MRFSWLIFVASVVFSARASFDRPPEKEAYLNHTCSGDHYMLNSICQKNLNTLLSSLYDYTSNGFYNSLEGDDSGDATPNVCQTYLKYSTADLPKRCTTQKEAMFGQRKDDSSSKQRSYRKTGIIVVSTFGCVALLIGMCMFIKLHKQIAKYGSNEQHEHSDLISRLVQVAPEGFKNEISLERVDSDLFTRANLLKEKK